MRTIIAAAIFIVFLATTILTYMSTDYVLARDRLKYLNSDLGRFSVEVEEHMNEWYGYDNHSSYREWHTEVERTEKIIQQKQTLCMILGGFSILSLGCTAVMFIQDKKQQKTTAEASLN